MADVVETGLLKPVPDFAQRVASSLLGREQHQERKKGAYGWDGEAVVEDMVLDDNFSPRIQTRIEFLHEPRVFFQALTVDDVGEKRQLVSSRYRVTPVITGEKRYPVLEAGVANASLGDFHRSRKIEDRCSEFRILAAKIDGIAART